MQPLRRIPGSIEYFFQSDDDLAEVLFAIGSTWDELAESMTEQNECLSPTETIEMDAQTVLNCRPRLTSMKMVPA